MKWEIKAITEQQMAKFITEAWPQLNSDEKKYLKELYLTICISNDRWSLDLEKILQAVSKRKKGVAEQTEDEEPEESEEVEDESDGDMVEVDAEEPEKPVKKIVPKYKMAKKGVE